MADARAPVLDMHAIVGSHDVLFVVLDTLRFDVAQDRFIAGRLPTLAPHLPPGGWERRHTPATFTYAAPVSYTHLDVYKRQASRRTTIRPRVSATCSTPSSPRST